MKRNFIEVMKGDGRCRVCDFFYSPSQPNEEHEHRAHHRRYLKACDGVGAPVHRHERARMMEVGTRLLVHGGTLAERVKGAERQLESLFHEHLAAVLLGHVTRRLDFFTFVTQNDVAAIRAQRPALALVDEVDELNELVQQVGPTTAYLGKAEAVLQAGHPWVDRMRERRGELMTKITSPKHRADSGFQGAIGQALAELKTAYQDAYLQSHAQARLGATDDQRKARLGQAPRLKQLQQISTIEMMPSQQLRDFQNTLFGLKTCFSLTKQDLDADPICPHCAFRPVEEHFTGTKAGDRIGQLDAELDDMVQSWTTTLLGNLQDPTVAGNIELLGAGEGRDTVETFLKSKSLPDPVSSAFVKALQEILSGLEKVVLTEARLRSALTDGGVPCTVGELKERFEAFVSDLTKGKDASRVRVVVER